MRARPVKPARVVVAPASSRRERLLADQRVRLWHENHLAGSKATATNFLGMLGLFCEQNGVDPHGLVRMDPEQRDDLVQAHVHRMAREGKAPHYIRGVMKALKSWLRFNRIPGLTRDIKVPRHYKRALVRKNSPPTPELLQQMFDVASPQQRAVIALRAFSDIRPEVLGTDGQMDVLRLKDLPDLDLGTLTFRRTPAMVFVRKELNPKAGVAYFSFLPSQGCSYVAAYLQERRAKGAMLTNESPVITATHVSRDAVKRSAIWKAVKTTMKTVGWTGTPYGLRKYFRHRASLGEGRGLTRLMAEFMMGHLQRKVEGVYAAPDAGDFHADAIEQYRAAYAACASLFETTSVGTEDPRLAAYRAILKVAGLSEREVRAADLEHRPIADAEALVQQALRQAMAEAAADAVPQAAPAKDPAAQAQLAAVEAVRRAVPAPTVPNVQIAIEPEQFDEAIGRGWRWTGIKAPDGRRLMVEAPATVPQFRTELQPAP